MTEQQADMLVFFILLLLPLIIVLAGIALGFVYIWGGARWLTRKLRFWLPF